MTPLKATDLLSLLQHNLKPSSFNLQRRSLHHVQDNNKYTWSVIKQLYQRRLAPANKKYACLLLNISDQCFDSFERYRFLWDNADLKVAVDGSANCLSKRRLLHTADVISGDFDSIDLSLIKRLQSPKRPLKIPTKSQDAHSASATKLPLVVETPNQRETDFTKAIQVAMSLKPELEYFFALYNIDGHRMDHFFGLINTLHILKKNIFVINVKSNNVSWLLSPGSHTILKPFGQELCSLVPLTGQTSIKTAGLLYNLNPAEPSSFGGLISTSNICQEQRDKVLIETNRELLWSIDLFDFNKNRPSSAT